ncbi:hypothetical protein [uncultured Shewanella sp.]|uniref:hypothetical protein n=1 Tax=Shewanella atlantica TaxID=271099 RepID=UPI002615B682|nr:hypothetical protein [uncultured Shewanella sp.]
MHINSNSLNTSPATQVTASKPSLFSPAQPQSDSPLSRAQPSGHPKSDSVTISDRAAQLSSQAQPSPKEAETLPATPNLPNEDEKLENYIEYRKARAQYQIYSDMAAIATGKSKGVSASTAYYLSNNDDARAAVVNSKAQQQQVSAMQTYANTAQAIDEWY